MLRSVFFSFNTPLWQRMLPLFLLCTFTSHASNFASIEHLAKVQAITQDNQGFIWLAGQHGLTRFDGANTITFSSSNTTWPIPFTWIHNISLEGNKLLLSTETEGVWEFNPLTGTAKRVHIDSMNKGIYATINYMDKYYVEISDSLYSFDPSTSSSDLIKNNLNIRQLEKTNKYLYISSETGLYRLTGDRLERQIDEPISTITPTDDGVIAISDSNIHYIGDDGYRHSIANTETIHATARESEKDNFFILNSKGVIKKFAARELVELKHNFPAIKPVYARDMMHDSSGVLWIISSQGVQQLTQSNIKNHPIIFNIANNANEIELFNEQVIIGSYGNGLRNFDQSSPVIDESTNQFFTPKGKKNMDLLSIGDDLYIASFDGLWRYQLDNKQLSRVEFFDNNKLLLKLRHKDNLLYIASNYDGFFIYDLNKKQITEQVDIDKGLSSAEIIDVLPLDDGNVWLATATGVDIYNQESKSVRNIDIPGPSKVLSLVLADNKVFATTKGDGMFVFSRQGEMLSRFALAIDFSQMSVFNNEIWAPAQHGLYRINPVNYKVSMVPNTEFYSFTDSPVFLENTVYIPHHGGILEVPLTKNEAFDAKVYISQTTVSGQSFLLNKSINVQSANDVITLELASLDFRPGKEKRYKYQINGRLWHPVSGNQLTLTGMASGTYNIEIMATNSMDEWSNNRAYTEIHVAYPWYWTPQIRVIYAITVFGIICMTIWLLYLRARSISHIHQLLAIDIKNRGKVALNVSQKLTMADQLVTENHQNSNTVKIKQLLTQSITELNTNLKSTEPNSLYGNSLLVALPYLSDYIHKKYHINIIHKLDIDENNINYEMQADIYKIIYEAINSAILNGDGRNFTITLQEFKHKLWINISDDASSFTQFKSKINFNMAMYYIRQIANKYNASINTFEEHDNGSQLVIIIPLMDIS